jgi:DNA-binding NarL/FixJ family response regulator
MGAQERNRISVLIVDDHPPTRAGIRSMIEKTPDLYVIGEAESGEEAQRLLAEFRPKIVLLDLVMPGFSPSGFERWARENYPETITLVLTSHDRDAYLASMIDAGAAGYLDKKLRAEQLIDAIRRAAEGAVYFSDEQIARARKWDEDVTQKWERLSHREHEILQHIAGGENNGKIADSLSISLKTVEFHITNILRKLDMNSRDEVIVWMLKHRPDDPWATEN